MEEKKNEVNLADMNEILNNKTLRYRINGFAYACNMRDIAVSGDSGLLFNTNGFDKYFNKENSDEHSYFISLNEYDRLYGRCITLKGQYEDLTFTFINHCGKNLKLDKKIVDLPFYISLEKKIDNETYQFEIETVSGMRTKFSMTKYRNFKDYTLHDDLCFYANVMDFSKILKLVKGFVYNPQLGFNTYNEIIHQQSIVFTNSMLDKMVMQDEKLDKPMGKVKKIIKRITNND